MDRKDCEKLLDAYECLISLCDEYKMHSDSEALTAHANLRDVIIGIMAGEGNVKYRDAITLSGIDWSKMTAPHVTKNVITCDVAKPKEGE